MVTTFRQIYLHPSLFQVNISLKQNHSGKRKSLSTGHECKHTRDRTTIQTDEKLHKLTPFFYNVNNSENMLFSAFDSIRYYGLSHEQSIPHIVISSRNVINYQLINPFELNGIGFCLRFHIAMLKPQKVRYFNVVH